MRVGGVQHPICFKDLQASQRAIKGVGLQLGVVLRELWMCRLFLKAVHVAVTVVAPTTQRCVAEVELESGTK